MTSVRKEESLSPDEMRHKLHQTFKNRGILNSLKTQLRNQLIQDLQRPARASAGQSVLVTACNSAVVDHLRRSGYEYTLSVFLPECGMSREQVLSSGELLRLLNISASHTSLGSGIRSGHTGFLMSLFTDRHSHRDRCHSSTQTILSAQTESLGEKLQLIDEEYEALRLRGERWPSAEEKLAEFRKQMEEQVEVELNARMQHFMDVEIARLKREEKEAARREMEELRREMERTQERREEALKSRERNAIERLHKQQEMEERNIYAERQAVLKEMECVRSRETELKLRIQAFDTSCALREQKLKTLEDLLRTRELSVKSMEESFQQKLQSELLKYQLELKEDHMKRTEALTEKEKRIAAETVRLQKESAVIDAKAEEHERLSSEVKRLQVELESVRSEASLLIRENQLLREKLEHMSDYSALKKDTEELQTHIRLLKHQLEEKHLENQRIQQEERVSLQQEIRRMEASRSREQQEFEAQKNVLHSQLQHEVQKCALLKAQLLECEERTEWMNAHTHQLQQQLQQTQQGPAPRGPRHPWSRSEAPEHDSGLVSGALARIQELEQEAERLEEAYRSHRQRAVRVAAAEDPAPARTFSGYRASLAPGGRPVEKEPERLSRTPSPGERNALRLISPPARRQSKRSAHPDAHSFSPDRIAQTSSDSDRAALVFAERRISPIPAGEISSSRDFISPPSSPRMKSTTRHSHSPPKLQEVISSSSQDSSPQPERITLHDLSDPAQFAPTDQECVVELFQDSRPEQKDAQASSSDAKRDAREDEEKSWEEERKRREERRQREREEAQEREQRELERLKQELEEQHESRAEGHVTPTTSAIGGGRDEEENPLQKYMMMVMQDKPQEQSPDEEASENRSPEELLLSGSNEHSAEEPDDFW